MSVDLSGGHKDMDYEEHRRTYKGFLIGTQALIGFVVALLVLMAVFLV
ncbi:MAG: aa3-type cytochrome c oxidase subunit IV [Alphaproteobacteria bacterium]|nr:aa3-type cytochrome c oxidase subunit IV [Alphaproteobacteria bacterium]